MAGISGEVVQALEVPNIDAIQLLMDALREDTVKFRVASDPDLDPVLRWRAFRKSDKSRLMGMHPGWKSGRPYKVDPLPKRMSQAFADFLFNEAPLVTPSDESDRQLMVDLLRETNFRPRLRVAADTCVSEREVWWRIYTDPMQSMWPILEWHSRLDVRPFMYGDRVLAVAIVNSLGQLVKDGPHYHHLEYHTDLRVVNALYRSGGEEELGQEIPLTDHPLTANIQEEWFHGLPMLAGRIKNEEDAVSIYDGIEDLLLDLNEAHTVDSENFRLAGKKRAAIPAKYKDQAGNINSGEEIIWTDDDWDEMESDGNIIRVQEYSYDADGSIKRKDDLERVILTRAGLVRQLVDANANEGLAQTGTALRTRLLPGVAAIEGKEAEWQGRLPHTLSLLAQVDALSEGEGGWGRPWTASASPPSVVVAPPLPVDEGEEAQRHQTLVTANLESIEAAVAEMHDDWSEEQRILEVKRILANKNGYALADDGSVLMPDGSSTPPVSNSTAVGGTVVPPTNPPTV